MLTSLFAFGSDVEEEGADGLAEAVAALGVGGIALAAAYHASRDLFPRASRRRVRYLRGGEAFFALDPLVWRGSALVPHAGAPVLDDLVRAAGARGMHVDAWTVFLHVDREPDGLPAGLAAETCFGDPLPVTLCPAQPQARDYAVRLARDIAGRGVRAVIAESLHHHPLAHGAHHERAFVALPPAVELLLGLCFCAGCQAAAADRGVDAGALRQRAREAVEAALLADAGGGAPVELRSAAAELWDGALGPYLDVREAAVTTLVAEVRAACAEGGAELVFLDASGAAKGYATGRPEGGPAPEAAWQFGVDVAAVARAAGGLGAIAYAADPERVASDLDAYRALAGADVALEAVLRPMRPDCDDAANLAAKVATCRDRGVRATGFYHYGMASAVALERVRVAVGVG